MSIRVTWQGSSWNHVRIHQVKFKFCPIVSQPLQFWTIANPVASQGKNVIEDDRQCQIKWKSKWLNDRRQFKQQLKTGCTGETMHKMSRYCTSDKACCPHYPDLGFKFNNLLYWRTEVIKVKYEINWSFKLQWPLEHAPRHLDCYLFTVQQFSRQHFSRLTYSPPQLFPVTCFCCYYIFLQAHSKLNVIL